MTEDYLTGAIGHAIERARALTNVVDQPYASAYDGLRQICSERLRRILSDLRQLEAEAIVDPSLQTPRRLRMYRRIIEQLRSVEVIGATALAGADKDAADLTATVRSVCGELRYPLVPPTVTNSSSSYLSIYSGFNLMMVPLLEGHFLLHLPDLYHELAHPFLDPHFDDRPALDAYREAFRLSLLSVRSYFVEARLLAQRERTPADFTVYLHLWEQLWSKYWLEELYCDAFAAMTCGPAYGWAHYHLTAQTAECAFETPIRKLKTHPADDARLRLICRSLEKLGFKEDAVSIRQRWTQLTKVRGDDRPPEYLQCYPDALIDGVVEGVWRSISEMGVTLALPGTLTNWPDRLGQAWNKFWEDPAHYPQWEKDALKLSRAGLHKS